MKLKNKKTGEIVDTLCSDDITKGISFGIDHHDGNPTMAYYNSLAELNKEWEDVPEEPKGYWHIAEMCAGLQKKQDTDNGEDRFNKEIGNYFETEEEAEKAVEKLKAITRLNKCGFRFEGYTDRDRANGGDIIIYAHIDIPNNNLLEEAQPAMLKDLDLLFGGGE